MAEPSEPEAPDADAGIYIDSSALAKLYVPERESDALDAFLRDRRGLMISELAVTEVLSAVARRRRSGELRAKHANSIREALLADANSGSFGRLDLSPAVHREAERLLFATDAMLLRTLDALHIALALSGAAQHILTFDRRMREAALHIGLNTIEL
jgi:predicted nucleic acid-binding protein